MDNKIVSEAYADLLIDNTSPLISTNAENITPVNYRYSMLHVPIENINRCSITQYPYHSFPSCFTLQSIGSLEKSGIPSIQNNPNFALYGTGVLIGVIDTGIDYRHEAFLRQDGTTKIASIWDQTINDDTPNSPNILYGTEYNREAINSALGSDDPLSIVPSVDDIGHGTMLAGIISGNESLDNDFRGVVPSSELVVVKLKQAKNILRDFFIIPRDAICYQETDILMGINYVLDVAEQLGRPIVICIALGSSQEDHEGRGALSSFLTYILNNAGIAVTVAAGNEGNARRHYFGIIDNRIGFNEFELNVGAGEYGFSMEVWQGTPHLLSIELISPSGERVNPIFPAINDCRRISLIFETTTIYINNIISESETGEQLILVRFQYPTEGIWRFRVTHTEGLSSDFNVWLPSGNLISDNTYFLNPDPNITLTSPANTPNPMTVTAYNHVNDSIWINSSRGYTRMGVPKPDLAAPGVELVAPVINNRYGRITGTGAAAAHAAGIMAIFLEWGIVRGNYPTLHGTEIKNILIRGATRDSSLVYPNNIWGYGLINVLGGFESLR